MTPLDIKALTTKQKIGLIMVARGFLNKEDRDFIYEMIKNKSLGGIQLPYFRGCEEEIKNIKSMAAYPLLICDNMSNGFSGSIYKIPERLSLAATNDTGLAYLFAKITASEATSAGYNTVWGPSVDMNDGRALDRTTSTFGSDPEKVSKISTAMLKGFQENGLFAMEKYWPGGRDIKVDTHMIVGKSYLTEEDLLKTDIIPYLDGMKNGNLRGIMTKHVIYENIDPEYPASMSEKLISILRNQGFDGLLITDSFAKMGVLNKYKEEECYGLAIKAGNDMVLPNYRVPFKTSYQYLLNSFKKGVFTESRLNEAVSKVINAQVGIINAPECPYMDAEEKEECVRRIERESICVSVDKGVPIKLDKEKSRLFVILSENMYDIEDNEKEANDTCCIDKDNIEAVKYCIVKRFPDNVIVINQFPSPTQIEKVCYRSSQVDEVVYVTYCASGSYKGSESLTENVINLMKATENKIAAVVHLGNPYAMEEIPHTPRLIMCFGGGVSSVEYSMAILKGQLEPKGVMPVEIKLKEM